MEDAGEEVGGSGEAIVVDSSGDDDGVEVQLEVVGVGDDGDVQIVEEGYSAWVGYGGGAAARLRDVDADQVYFRRLQRRVAVLAAEGGRYLELLRREVQVRQMLLDVAVEAESFFGRGWDRRWRYLGWRGAAEAMEGLRQLDAGVDVVVELQSRSLEAFRAARRRVRALLAVRFGGGGDFGEAWLGGEMRLLLLEARGWLQRDW